MAANVTHTDQFMRTLGVEVYRVGGSVRDEILGRPIKDCDYMVRGISLTAFGMLLSDKRREGALDSMKVLSDRDGRQLGYRIAKKGLGMIEITLPRVEVSTGPGHRDFDIKLDPTLPLFEDAKRRDFTFNALYRCLSDGRQDLDIVSDPTNRGLYDLQHKLVATTYPTSFRDDPLRILRAARFVSTLGYDLATHTWQEMIEHASALDGLTYQGREAAFAYTDADGWTTLRKRMPGDQGRPTTMSGTVKDEMAKILMGDSVAKALRILAETGSLGTLFPELAPMIGFDQASKYHDMTTDEHTFSALATAAKCDAPLRVRWALLFHDSGKPAAAWVGEDGRKHYYGHKTKDRFGVEYETPDHEVVSERLWRRAATRMGMDRSTREEVSTLIREHMVACTGKIKPAKVRRARVRLGDAMLRDLHMHRMCDLTGKGKSNRGHLIHVMQQEDIRRQAEQAGIPASTKQLKVGGQDAMAKGLEGKDIGRALADILDEVVAQPTEQKLTREWQLRRLEAVA